MTLNVPVRQDILASWQRCVVAGLRPDRFEVPYQPDFDDDGPLRWAAAPILDQVADELEGTGVGLLLTDGRGQVVDRRAADTGILTRLDRIELAPGFLYGESLIGTNAIGTAIAQQALSVVTGTEHFADALTSMACAATPMVRSHLRRVFRKLGVRSQVELARVIEQGSGRARTMAAVDDTRRRIERDLHDGLQQRLVTLGLQVRAAEASVPAAAAELKWELARVADGLMDALRDVREISRGIHPAILSERGLAPAVEALARRSPVPVDLTVRVAGRLSDRLELGAYYIVSEALANVAKHANAEIVMVSVEADRGVLSLSVRDDGVGGADPDGSGLTGLRERAEALGGTLQLTSLPGRGTSVDVRLPAAAL